MNAVSPGLFSPWLVCWAQQACRDIGDGDVGCMLRPNGTCRVGLGEYFFKAKAMNGSVAFEARAHHGQSRQTVRGWAGVPRLALGRRARLRAGHGRRNRPPVAHLGHLPACILVWPAPTSPSLSLLPCPSRRTTLTLAVWLDASSRRSFLPLPRFHLEPQPPIHSLEPSVSANKQDQHAKPHSSTH